MNGLFYISGAVAVTATFLVITRSNPVHALLYLILSLFAVALVFFSLGAGFAAAMEVIVYAGAIMVLFVFVIMMLNVGRQDPQLSGDLLKPSLWTGPSILAGILLVELIYVLIAGANGTRGSAEISPKQVGMSLFGPYVLGVELASVLLLAGLVGAYHLGARNVQGAKQ